MTARGLNHGDLFDFTGKVAVVTGAGTGVGAATAKLLGACGADVVVAARRNDLLEQTADDIRLHGGRATAIQTDVRSADDCQRLITSTIDEFGRVDILVNSAGGAGSAGPEGWTERDWVSMIELNLHSVWRLCIAGAQAMRTTGGGAIVNVSSIAGLNPNPTVATYGIAKAGVIHLTSTLGVDFATDNIRVNCVALGMIKSEGFLKAMDMLERDPDDQGDKILFGRPGTVDEAAYPIMFLASGAASYITGETLFVGGGPRGWTREATAP